MSSIPIWIALIAAILFGSTRAAFIPTPSFYISRLSISEGQRARNRSGALRSGQVCGFSGCRFVQTMDYLSNVLIRLHGASFAVDVLRRGDI